MRFFDPGFALVFAVACCAQNGLLLGQEKLAEETICVTGRIIDAGGQGVAGAMVGLAHCLDNEMEQQIATTTKADGTYELDLALKETNGAFRTFVMAARGAKRAWNSQYVVRGKSSAVAAPDLVLKPSRLLKLKVVDERGNAIPDAAVEYVYTGVGSGDEQLFDQRLAKILETSFPRSAADGSLALDFLPDVERYRVSVSHPDFAQELAVVSDQPQSHNVVLSAGRLIRIQVNCEDRSAIAATTIMFRRANRSHQETLTISPDGGGTIRMKLQQALSIQLSHPSLAPVPPYLFLDKVDDVEVSEFDLVPIGRVVGKVIDAQFGGAAVDVEVTAVDPKNRRVVGKAKTDGNGAYEIACPATKSIITLAHGSNWESDDQHTVDVKPQGDTQAPSITATGLRPLIGRVLTSSNEPSHAIISHGFRGFPVITKPDGTFVFSREHFRKPPQPNRVGRFQRPMELLFVFDTVSGETAVVPVDLSSTRPCTVKLNKPTSVVGTVVDVNGKPVAGVGVDLTIKVQHTFVYSQGRAYSDHDGKFRFAGLVSGTDYAASTSFDFRLGAVDFVAGQTPDMGNVVFDKKASYRIDNSTAVRKMMATGRTPVPLADGTWVNGDEIAIADCQGKLVVLHFWSSKDPESQRYFPLLQLLHEQHADDCVVISIHKFVEDTETSIQDVIAKHKLGFRVMVDNPLHANFYQYGGRARGHIVVIDRDGKLNGDLKKGALLNKIFSNLTEKAIMPAAN